MVLFTSLSLGTLLVRNLFPLMLFVLIAASRIFGAPLAPSAIAIGLSRKAKPSIARMGLPGSILSVGILVHCAIFHLTKSTYSLRRSRRHPVYARQHLPTTRLLGARFPWRPRSLAHLLPSTFRAGH